MSPTLQRIGLGILMFSAASLGLWAQFAPQDWYDSFPLDRAWVAVDGPYNEHLVRDFGGLNLALAVLTGYAFATLDRRLVLVTGLATLAFHIPHFVYHVNHLDLYDGVDAAANVVTLASAQIIAGALALFPARVSSAGWSDPTAEPSPTTSSSSRSTG